MVDLVFMPKGLPVRECYLVGRLPVCRIIGSSVGRGGDATDPVHLGPLPHRAQSFHQQVPPHQWECFAEDHETWLSVRERQPDLPLQEWVEERLLIFSCAVPPHEMADVWAHNDVWATLMVRKRRCAARQGF